jgi:hypothetical protein
MKNRRALPTRISCLAALDTTTCAAFIKESRMKFADATELYRKSGGCTGEMGTKVKSCERQQMADVTIFEELVARAAVFSRMHVQS